MVWIPRYSTIFNSSTIFGIVRFSWSPKLVLSGDPLYFGFGPIPKPKASMAPHRHRSTAKSHHSSEPYAKKSPQLAQAAPVAQVAQAAQPARAAQPAHAAKASKVHQLQDNDILSSFKTSKVRQIQDLDIGRTKDRKNQGLAEQETGRTEDRQNRGPAEPRTRRANQSQGEPRGAKQSHTEPSRARQGQAKPSRAMQSQEEQQEILAGNIRQKQSWCPSAQVLKPSHGHSSYIRQKHSWCPSAQKFKSGEEPEVNTTRSALLPTPVSTTLLMHESTPHGQYHCWCQHLWLHRRHKHLQPHRFVRGALVGECVHM